MAECSAIAMVAADDDEETFLYTVGKPLRERQVKIISQDETSPQEMLTGAVGEIIMRPPGITRYFSFDVETGKIVDLMPQLVDEEGWLHTGDLGFIDARGNLRLVGRKKHIILRGGNTIYPEPIRGLIATYDKVKEVAVIGLPDPIYGEKIRACVILKDNVTCSASEIKAFCRERLEVFKIPDEVRFCDSFPLAATGKVKLTELRQCEEGIPVVAEVES
jgi:acyl-CoA synthetase (AMP-forming)/AMP-acid ligase II